MKNEYDVLVVGAGPAGLTTAWQVAASSHRRVLLIDTGPDLADRNCPAIRAHLCPSCRHCDLLQGVGGASGIVGGKLCYFPAGERLARHSGFTSDQANEAVVELLARLQSPMPTPNLTPVLDFPDPKYATPGIRLKGYQAFPVLAEELRGLFARMREAVLASGVDLHAGTTLQSLERGAGNTAFDASIRAGSETLHIGVTEAVVLATGRSTAAWLTALFNALGVVREDGVVDVGVRLECDARTTADMLANYEDPKLLLRSGSEREVRTLCWCRGGNMTVTSMGGYQLVDGHFGPAYSDRTSVSVVARRPVPPDMHAISFATSLFGYEPKQHPMRTGLSVFLGIDRPTRSHSLPVLAPCATQAMSMERMSPALLADLREFIGGLVDLTAGELLNDPSAVVYGPVIDQQWQTPRLDRDLQTNVPGLYVAGDVQGRARGIVQAMFSGCIAARAILGTQACTAEISSLDAKT